jgi:hypothetical protein
MVKKPKLKRLVLTTIAFSITHLVTRRERDKSGLSVAAGKR